MSMDRAEALNQIVTFGPERKRAIAVLASYDYDSENELFEISQSVLINVLEKYLLDEITVEELENWANFVECRDDLNYEKFEANIYSLANPYLVGEINKDKINQMLLDLYAL